MHYISNHHHLDDGFSLSIPTQFKIDLSPLFKLIELTRFRLIILILWQ